MPVGKCVIRTAEEVLLTLCPPRAARMIKVHAQVFVFYLNFFCLGQLGYDVDACETRVPARRRVERAYPHQTVDADLG